MLFALLGVVVVVGGVVALIYNDAVAKRQRTRQAWSDVDVQLKQRIDLIPNLVETVKGYAAHEQETLDAVIKARQASIDAGDHRTQAAAEDAVTGALRRVFALAEAYPDLKANQNFLQLQRDLTDVENNLSAARRFFNSATSDYNTALEQFPGVLFLKNFGFEPETFFEVPAGQRAEALEPPKVAFD
ncbi:MAG: LemA family protein [Maricaulaceae bacterium]